MEPIVGDAQAAGKHPCCRRAAASSILRSAASLSLGEKAEEGKARLITQAYSLNPFSQLIEDLQTHCTHTGTPCTQGSHLLSLFDGS
jgi:hypothetical protein